MGFLAKLQSLDEPSKRRWITVISAFVMVIVIFLWLAYFNAFVVPAKVATTGESAPAGVSLFDGLRSGSAVIGDGFLRTLRGLGHLFRAPKDYTITPN